MSDPVKPSPPHVLHAITTGLAGWNIGVMTGIVVFLSVSQGLGLVLGGIQDFRLVFWICASVAVVFGVVAGYFGGRRLHRYFSKFELVGSYVWLSVMIYLMLSTLPI